MTKSKSREFSRKSFGLRQNLIYAFGLIIISFLPLLGYLFPGIASIFSYRQNLIYVVLFAIVILVLAFYWLRQVILIPLVQIRDDARRIAGGDFDKTVSIVRHDEIGDLGQALNQMTSHIKDSMQELRVYSEKTEAVNIEINKRILTLSCLLHISNLVSQNIKPDDIFKEGVARLIPALKLNLACIILKNQNSGEYEIKVAEGYYLQESILSQIRQYRIDLSRGFIGKAILSKEIFVIGEKSPLKEGIKEFKELFHVQSAMGIPLAARSGHHGLMIVGVDDPHHVFSTTDREFMNLLAMQFVIALENTLLASRVEKLEIIDHLTGLYNSAYIRTRLDEEIKRAISFQRPCAFVNLSVDHFKEYQDSFGNIVAENALIKVAAILKGSMSNVDKVARFGDHAFALVLPEKNKRQSIEVAEDLRKKVEFIFSEEGDVRRHLTLSGGVTENPVDGTTADELIAKSAKILDAACRQGTNRIHY